MSEQLYVSAVRITSERRISSPEPVCGALDVEPADDVRDDVATVVPTTEPRGHGRQVVDALRGTGDGMLSTEEIMAMSRGD
ncbi:hypothetical protein [Pseudonocardia sp. TRM90224]|uniref:hypothetical protein n=1 Tax=Pseudonocardia sp. TRM90224 TaxID=2812678 RepID=UPI001E34FA98|nr:hypothetical protein [Pseudonocardia sp. TRM90224]